MIVHKRPTRGAKAAINVWTLSVEFDQYSLAKVSICYRSGAEIENIQAGWMISISQLTPKEDLEVTSKLNVNNAIN